MEPREEITPTDTVMDVVLKLCEGNPGAAVVLRNMMEKEDDLTLLLDLDDMNIRGTQIWVGYKDYCNEDLKKFKTLVFSRDKKMVAHINRQGIRGNHKWKAVCNGASFGKRELLKK